MVISKVTLSLQVCICIYTQSLAVTNIFMLLPRAVPAGISSNSVIVRDTILFSNFVCCLRYDAIRYGLVALWQSQMAVFFDKYAMKWLYKVKQLVQFEVYWKRLTHHTLLKCEHFLCPSFIRLVLFEERESAHNFGFLL